MFDDNSNQSSQNIKITKQDVEGLFEEKKSTAKKDSNVALKVLKWTGLVLLIVVVGFSLVNAPAIYNKSKYFVYNTLLNRPYPSDVSGISVSADITNEFPNDYLIIPKIGVDAPVIWNVDQQNLRNELSNGLVHLADSSLPSDPTGNVFIVGSSSNFWVNNEYSATFSLLNEITSNDYVVLNYDGYTYTYKVTNKQVTNTADIQITKPNDQKLLTLMTWTPIGTYLNKLIVTAELLTESAEITPAQDEADTEQKFTETSDPTVTTAPTPTPPSPEPYNTPTATQQNFLPSID